MTLPSEFRDKYWNIFDNEDALEQTPLEQAEHIKKWLKLFILYSFTRSILKENLHYQKHSHATKLVERRYHVGYLVNMLGGVVKVARGKHLNQCILLAH